jgi:hypothetical protein
MRHPTWTQSSRNVHRVRSFSALRALPIEPWQDDAATRTQVEHHRSAGRAAKLATCVLAAVLGLGSLLGAGGPETLDGVASATPAPAPMQRADIVEDLLDLLEDLLGRVA